jgi:hypothetical protein
MAASAERAEKKLAKKAEKSRKKAAKKQYERNHAQLKRQQAFHTVLLAGQARRNKKQAGREAS